jgi:hypothetical protein
VPGLIPEAEVRVCAGINHIALAGRPEVYDEIAGWWDEPGATRSEGH